jgi:uncharacterized OB-fold protein
VEQAHLRIPSRRQLHLQRCDDCGAVSYPPRERCGSCLGGALAWRPCDPAGRVTALATVAHSHDRAWKDRLPVDVASVVLDSGPVALAFAPLPLTAGERCALAPVADAGGCVQLVALPPDTTTAAIRDWLTRLQLKEIPA